MRRKILYQDDKITIYSLKECGKVERGMINLTYKKIVDKLGYPNVMDIDKRRDIFASWGISLKGTKRKAFIWTKLGINTKNWYMDGDMNLLEEIFFNI